jgi:hypothetical protein
MFQTNDIPDIPISDGLHITQRLNLNVPNHPNLKELEEFLNYIIELEVEKLE